MSATDLRESLRYLVLADQDKHTKIVAAFADVCQAVSFKMSHYGITAWVVYLPDYGEPVPVEVRRENVD